MRCPACGGMVVPDGRFCPHCGAPRSSPPGARGGDRTDARSEAPAPAGRLERRQLTIMFSDLVGSTSLAERMDPEDFGRLIEDHRSLCMPPIQRYEGTLARYLGDGMLVLFGYPQAHEDDAERAVRAGLELVAATEELGRRRPDVERMTIRIGIHTGIVVVGDLKSGDVSEPMAVFGEAPNVAARLQSLAPPNTVVVSGASRTLLRQVRCRSRGRVAIKGLSKRIAVYQAVPLQDEEAAASAPTRPGALAPFVNRERELEVLEHGWRAAENGTGRAVLVTGEAGIGKSRLMAALEERIGAGRPAWFTARASPYATSSDFFAFAELFRRLLRVGQRRRAAVPLSKHLAQALAERGLGSRETLLGLATLLGLDLPELAQAETPPQRLREMALEAVSAWFRAHAERTGCVLLVEDLHWADASTLEAIDALLADLSARRMLLVLTSRQAATGLARGSELERLHLDRLDERAAETLLGHVLHGKSLPRLAVDSVLERANGVPLFIEELAPAAGGAAPARPKRRAGSGSAGRPLIPPTLRDSLMARLDRLGPARTVAHVAAVLGHSFDVATMGLLWDGSEQTLRQGLDRLVEEALFVRSGEDPESAGFAFRHALIEEVAYDSLLRDERRRYHARAAEIFSARCGALADVRPEVTARHHAAAGDHLAAFESYLEAGRAATRRSANAEALAHLDNAATELARLEPSGGGRRDLRRAALEMARAPVLIALSGWAAPEVEQAYRSALTIRERTGATGPELFDAWRGLYNVYLLRGDLGQARSVAVRLHRIAARSGERDFFLGSHRALGLCDFLAGRFRRAVGRLDQAIALYDPVQHRQHAFIQGTDPAAIAHSISAWAHWFLGRPQPAAEHGTAAIEAARRVDHPFSMAYALCLTASLEQCRGRPRQAAERAGEALDLSIEHAFAYWRAWASMVKGWAMVETGERADGLALLEEGLERYRKTGAAQMRSYGLCLLAEANARAGRPDAAAEAAGEAIAEAERSGVAFYLPEACRLRGLALLRLEPGSRDGLRLLVRALRLAAALGAEALVLRAGLALLSGGRRRPLRTVALARATLALKRIRPACEPADLLALEERFAEVASGVAMDVRTQA